MGIADLKQHLRQVPGIENLTMRYTDKDHQTYSLGYGIEAVLAPQASNAEIEAALVKAIASKP